MSDLERIWLQPECCAGVPWTEYVRADLHERLRAEVENLKHDNARLVEACAEQATEMEGLRQAAELPRASAEDAEQGWTFDPKFLDSILDHIGCNEFAPSMEGVELVLLAYEALAAGRKE